MNSIECPYRYDVVGSFLRTETLKQDRKEFAEGTIDASELRLIH
ncbi:hypothetical protein [Enterococcus saccharolyticus]